MNQKPIRLNAVNSGFKAWRSTTELVNVVDADNHPVPEPKILSDTGEDPDISILGTKQDVVSYWTRENEKDFNEIFKNPTPPN